MAAFYAVVDKDGERVVEARNEADGWMQYGDAVIKPCATKASAYAALAARERKIEKRERGAETSGAHD